MRSSLLAVFPLMIFKNVEKQTRGPSSKAEQRNYPTLEFNALELGGDKSHVLVKPQLQVSS